MAYKYDIFVSYKRNPEVLGWIRKHFLPLLSLQVELELGHEPKIFVHEVNQQIPAGAAWPHALGKELGASRVLVALWTKTFFNSVWCAKEMSHMLAREQESGARDGDNEYGLVIPAVIHDGDEFPQDLDYIQRMDLKSVFNPRMREDSARAEELSDLIGKHAAGIARAIDVAPKWKKAWPKEAAEEFYEQFYEPNKPAQKQVPRFQPK